VKIKKIKITIIAVLFLLFSNVSFCQNGNVQTISYKNNPTFIKNVILNCNTPVYKEPVVRQSEFETWEEFNQRKSQEIEKAKEQYNSKMKQAEIANDVVYKVTDYPVPKNVSLNYDIVAQKFKESIMLDLGQTGTDCSFYYSFEFNSSVNNVTTNNAGANYLVFLKVVFPTKEAQLFKNNYYNSEPHTVDLVIQRKMLNINNKITEPNITIIDCKLKDKNGTIVLDYNKGAITEDKTESIYFYNKLRGLPPNRTLSIEKKNGQFVEGRIKDGELTLESVTIQIINIRNPSFSFVKIDLNEIKSFVTNGTKIGVETENSQIVENNIPEDILKDTRDGRTYKYVQIGSQIWMASNLNFDATGSFTYDNKEENSAIFGRLYNWESAKKVCPQGWHLPNLDEWMILIDYVGGEKVAGGKLKQKGPSGWVIPNNGATDEYGFCAMGGGFFLSNNSKFFKEKETGHWWTSSENQKVPGSAILIRIYSYSEDIQKAGLMLGCGLSVRCIKNF
jgi:uncharacterized protein (TIGR02145 family)